MSDPVNFTDGALFVVFGVSPSTGPAARLILMARFNLAPGTARRLAEGGCSAETARELWSAGERARVDPARTDG